MDRAGATEGGSRGSVTSRGRAIIAAACCSALLAACASAATAGGKPSATGPGGTAAAAGSGAATPAAARTPAASPSELFDLMDLSGADSGLIGLGTGPLTAGYARLVASTDYGRSFTAIGPKTAAWTASDDVFFLGRQDAWYLVFNVNTLAETLYRTTDGGHTWHASTVPSHGMAAGDSDIAQFVTPSRGWLVVTIANAPAEFLYATTDGGTSWHLVASLRGQHGGAALPELGQIRFEPGGEVGWLGGGVCSGALYRTADGGRTWQRSAIAAPAGSAFGLPAGSPQALLEPVITSSGTLLLDGSTDGGARWSQVSALSGAANPGQICGLTTVSVSFPSAQVGWATAVRGTRTVVYRTTDGGRHWARLAGSWPVPAGSQQPPAIQATDATHAWLQIAGGSRVYATVDGGATWRRIDTAAIAAGS